MRTDQYRPTSIRPEDFSYFTSIDNQPPLPPLFPSGIDMGNPGTRTTLAMWEAQVQRHNERLEQIREQINPEADHRSTSQCGHCGAHIRYGVIYRENETGYLLVVGSDCADNTMDVPDRATLDIKRLRDAAATQRENQRIEAERVANVDESTRRFPEAVTILTDYSGDNTFIQDVAPRFQRWGRISEKQANAVVNAAKRDQARQEQRQAEAGSPVVEGKGVQISGEVVNTSVKETAYGTRFVMIVLDDRGFKVWGSQPGAVEVNEGDRISFVANVERSDRDETFGFFKRPRKVQV